MRQRKSSTPAWRSSPRASPSNKAPGGPARPAAAVPRRACPCGGGCPRCRGGPTVGGGMLSSGPSATGRRNPVPAPGDPREREAERLADAVLQGPLPDARLPAQKPSTLSGAAGDLGLGPGRALPEGERRFFEPRFGRSLDHVRLHTDRRGARTADAYNARALTHGRNIAFARGQYRPQTTAGRRLLAHELSHALYHRQAGGRPPVFRTPGAGVDRVEVDCSANHIVFYQNGKPYKYELLNCDPDLEAKEYTANVNKAKSYINLQPEGGGSHEAAELRYRLNNEKRQGNPFKLFGAQETVRVIVWNTGNVKSAPTIEAAEEAAKDKAANEGKITEQQGKGGKGKDKEGGVVISPGASETDRKLVLKMLRRLHGHKPDSDLPAVQGYVSMADIRALRRLFLHPRTDELIESLRTKGRPLPGNEIINYANLIETAIANDELKQAGARFGFALRTGGEGGRPLVNRPVRGRIQMKGTHLVPEKEAIFEFVEEDRVDKLAVPHVFIKWYAERLDEGEPESDEPNVVESETTNYIAVRSDSFLNDRQFEVTFEKSGTYRVHAFVLHSFYLPAHFATDPLEVKTEKQALADAREKDKTPVGTIEASDSYKFLDVEAENRRTEISITVISPVVGGALMASGAGESGVKGQRRTGKLTQERLAAGAKLEDIAQQSKRVRKLRDKYKKEGDEELHQWAVDRVKQLEALHERLKASVQGQASHPVVVEGHYVSRGANVPSGELQLASWFTYDAGDDRYTAYLIDHSEMVRSRNFEFEAQGGDLDQVYERIFFELSSTYPEGRMSFAYQQYTRSEEGVLAATDRFVEFERPTDTLLNDIQETVFSKPVSIIVNVASAILTVFPPTTAVGIGLSLAYNGADTALNLLDASRSGTVSAANYVDLALLAVDIIPGIGKALKLGDSGLYMLRVGSQVADLAGNAYVFSATAYQQIKELRSGDVQRLADLQTEINLLIEQKAPSRKIAEKQKEARHLERKIRTRAEEIFVEMALEQGIQIVSQKGAAKLAKAAGVKTGALPAEGAPAEGRPIEAEPPPDEATKAFVEEGKTARAREDLPESQLVERAEQPPVRIPDTDPTLSRGLPVEMRADVPVQRSAGEHGSVRVHAERGRFGVKKIWIEAGQKATTRDIADHVAAVRLLQRYQGVTGAIRSALEYAGGIVQGLPPDAVRRGRELRGEIEKLPKIIQRRAAELELKRESLTEEEIATHEAQIRDLQDQLDGYRLELSNLSRASEAAGYIAALDRVLEGTTKAISGDPNLTPQQRPGARRRFEAAAEIVSRVRQRISNHVDPQSTLSDSDVEAIRGKLHAIIFDPVFGDLALKELQRREAQYTGLYVKRRNKNQSIDRFVNPFLKDLRDIDQQRRKWNEAENKAALAIESHRARPDVPARGEEMSGTIAAGVLTVEDAQGKKTEVTYQGNKVILGTSPHATPEGESAPVDETYTPKTKSGEKLDVDEWINHAEQKLTGRARQALKKYFPDLDLDDAGARSGVKGELNMHIEQAPCSWCLAGISERRGGEGPLFQFSKQFPKITIIAVYPTGKGTKEVIKIRNGEFVNE